MTEQLTVQEDYFRAWCESWAPGTYDKLTEEEKEQARQWWRDVSFHRQLALANWLRYMKSHAAEIRAALWGEEAKNA